MKTRPVVVFSTRLEGHFRRLRPLVAGLTRRGVPVHVYAHRDYRHLVERAGGRFVDLFARHTLEDADSESTLFGCRCVSFAGHYADEIQRDVRRLDPGLVVYDTFAVIGRVVGLSLGVPYVNVCTGHNLDPARYVREITSAVRVEISERCHRAVELLRQRHGLDDASPFSYLSGTSPYLNIYSEPRAWLPEAGRPAFEPVVFYGSLPPSDELEAPPAGPPLFTPDPGKLKVYASFGTVVWHYWPEQTLAPLETVADFVSSMENATSVISVGGTAEAARAVDRLTRPNVVAAPFVDQWQALREADVFVTHNGLSSTHEAIFHGVPMLSYPIFADQPELAELCRSFGLAVPLVREPLAVLTRDDLERAFTELDRTRDSLHAGLARAREWELDAVRARDSVHDRLVRLMAQVPA